MSFSKPGLVLTTIILVAGCYKPRPVIPLEALRLPLPTKDEVALVDNRPLSIEAYLSIRSQMNHVSPEEALWTGITMLALQNKAKASGKEISTSVALDIARYALRELPREKAEGSLKEYYRQTAGLPPPEEVKKELDALAQKSVVIKNPVPLSSFN